jgi:hypothetical protein
LVLAANRETTRFAQLDNFGTREVIEFAVIDVIGGGGFFDGFGLGGFGGNGRGIDKEEFFFSAVKDLRFKIFDGRKEFIFVEGESGAETIDMGVGDVIIIFFKKIDPCVSHRIHNSKSVHYECLF